MKMNLKPNNWYKLYKKQKTEMKFTVGVDYLKALIKRIEEDNPSSDMEAMYTIERMDSYWKTFVKLTRHKLYMKGHWYDFCDTNFIEFLAQVSQEFFNPQIRKIYASVNWDFEASLNPKEKAISKNEIIETKTIK